MYSTCPTKVTQQAAINRSIAQRTAASLIYPPTSTSKDVEEETAAMTVATTQAEEPD